jgi:polygalacturonase
MAPGQEPGTAAGGSDKQHRAFVVSSWLGAAATRVSGPIGALTRRKPSVGSGRDPLRQRRLVVVTFLACLATLAGSIAASTQLSGAGIASANARAADPRTSGAGTSTGSPSPSTGAPALNTSRPGSKTRSPGPQASSSETNTSGPGVGSYSTFSCSASGSSATTRVMVTGLNSNGSGDDFAAIQNAINMAGQHGGGIVALAAGTFVIDGHLTLRDNVELTGVGPATVIKAGPGFLSTQGPGGGYSLISTAGASNITIADLTADQSGDTLDGNVPARLAGYVVEGYNSGNVVVDGVYVRNPFTYSIAMVQSTDFCIENCNVAVTTANRYNQLDGIHILDSNSGTVINNTIKSGDDGMAAHTIGAPVFDVLFANNNVFGGDTDAGLQLAVGGFPIYGIEVEGNNFYGSLYGIRVGYYGDQIGSVSDISINANYIHNLAQGQLFPAIDMDGPGKADPITDVTVTGNRICQAGAISLQPGPDNVVTKTTGCYGN